MTSCSQCCQIIFSKFRISYFKKSVQIPCMKNPYNSICLQVVSLISPLLFVFSQGYYILGLFKLNTTLKI